MNEATGRPKPPISCPPVRTASKGSGCETEPQKAWRAIDKDAEASRCDAAKKGLMEQ